MKKNVDVAIIMGSDSDLPIMKDAAVFLDKMGIFSVHRCPEKSFEYAKDLKERKIKVIIAGARWSSTFTRCVCSTSALPCYWSSYLI